MVSITAIAVVARVLESRSEMLLVRLRGEARTDPLATSGSPSLPDVRVSAGITTTTVPLEIETMLEHVDCALYAAKRGGRDRTVVLDGHAMSVTV